MVGVFGYALEYAWDKLDGEVHGIFTNHSLLHSFWNSFKWIFIQFLFNFYRIVIDFISLQISHIYSLSLSGLMASCAVTWHYRPVHLAFNCSLDFFSLRLAAFAYHFVADFVPSSGTANAAADDDDDESESASGWLSLAQRLTICNAIAQNCPSTLSFAGQLAQTLAWLCRQWLGYIWLTGWLPACLPGCLPAGIPAARFYHPLHFVGIS